MDLKDIEPLLKLAKKHKLKRLVINGVEFEFRDPSTRHKDKTIREVTQGPIPIHGEQMPSDDEMMFYSSESAIQPPKTN